MDNNCDFNQMIKNTNTINKVNSKNKENKLKSILTNNIFLLVISILTFVFTSIAVTKMFYLKNKVDHFENFTTEVEQKISSESIVYFDKKELNPALKGSQIGNYINCLNENISIENLPENIKNTINEINNFYNQSINYFSFKYKDLYTGFTVS